LLYLRVPVFYLRVPVLPCLLVLPVLPYGITLPVLPALFACAGITVEMMIKAALFE
jgi:hypothetical protein